MKKPIISPELSLTFSDYFKLGIYVEDAVNYFAYQYHSEVLSLEKSEREISGLTDLISDLQLNLLRVDLTNEISRREFLIAPVLTQLLEMTETRIRTEYPIEVSHQLKGTFDYLLKSRNRFLLVEAKNADLKRGFTQLAVEMIALDQAGELEQELIFGAVSTGDSWKFGKLNRADKTVIEDLTIYNVPQNVEDVLRMLIGVLQ